jgi:cytosolic carboxypeptidase protein 2/3
MMEGFIRYLLSTEAHFLRDKMVFKIVPMVNVDGVVLGNFRTGIAGRDLNRVFTSPHQYK